MPSISVQSPLEWLRVTPSTDAMFRSRVDQAIGWESAEALKDILPYSVVISNLGSESLAAIGLRFELRSEGKVVYRDFFYHSFLQPGLPVLPAGQSRVFTPLRAANTVAARAVATKGGSGGAMTTLTENQLSAIRQIASAGEIRVSIDVAVAQDGRTAGPDRALALKQMARGFEAFITMREECVSRLRRGDSDAAMQSWLAPYAAQRIVGDRDAPWGDRYTATQKQLATAWSGLLAAGKRGELESSLSFPVIAYSDVIRSLKGGLK
jgi:hypothetical protein